LKKSEIIAIIKTSAISLWLILAGGRKYYEKRTLSALFFGRSAVYRCSGGFAVQNLKIKIKGYGT
jgi:hypothetical protein